MAVLRRPTAGCLPDVHLYYYMTRLVLLHYNHCQWSGWSRRAAMTVTAQQAGTEPGGSAGTLAMWVADVRMGDAAQETRSR